jgi:hypothetical protein
LNETSAIWKPVKPDACSGGCEILTSKLNQSHPFSITFRAQFLLQI